MHGIRLSQQECPYTDSEITLKPGTVLAIASGIFNLNHGGVRLCDVIIIDDEGVSIAGGEADSSGCVNRSLTGNRGESPCFRAEMNPTPTTDQTNHRR